MSFGKIGQTLSALEIFDLVRADLEKVDREIGLESVASVEAINYINQYLQAGGGKRLRPILVLLSGRMLGDANPMLIRMAAVVEMIHTATLVHDDVIDLAKTRRGRPSINVVWGNHTSVLAGDWLYMQAFQVAVRERNFSTLDLLISLTQMMVEGELLQLERIGKIAISEADYFELIDRKTASLFSACARLGAISAGADELVETQLADYAWNLGIAFQLVDDILDFTSREKILGKPVGNDLREGKVTLPLIHLQQHEKDGEGARIVREVIASRAVTKETWQDLQRRLREHASIEYANRRAVEFAENAKKHLYVFPAGAEREALLALPDYVLSRDR